MTIDADPREAHDMAQDIRAVLVDPDISHRLQLKQLLDTLAIAVVGEAEYGVKAARRAAELQPEVVLVHIEEPLDLALHTLDVIQRAAPHATLVAVSRRTDANTVRYAMLAGARGFIVTPTTSELLGQTLRAARQRHTDLMQRALSPDRVDPTLVAGTVLTVFGPKGGVGRTTLATNLAIALAAHTRARVALVDADAYFGDVAIMMGIEADGTLPALLEALAMGHHVDVDSYFTRHVSGVYVLPAHHSGNITASLDPDALAALLRRLAASFDFVIVDTSGTFGPQAAAALDESTTVLLVTSADIASVKDARLSLKALRREGFDRNRLKLVVNHATNANAVTDDDIARALGYEVFWTFPHDRKVPHSTQRGEPLVMWQPRARMAQRVEALAAHLAGTPGAKGNARAGSRFSLFRRK